jgi:hypothetical protein
MKHANPHSERYRNAITGGLDPLDSRRGVSGGDLVAS